MRYTQLISRLSLLGAVVALSGCQEPPANTAEDLVAYVRNATAGAKARRLDPAAQAYVDSVMESYMAYRAYHAPIDALSDPKALWELESLKAWSPDAAEWRQADKVAQLVESCFVWAADPPKEAPAPDAGTSAEDTKATESEEKKAPEPKSRSEALAAVCAAIESVPPEFAADRDEITAGIHAHLSLQAAEDVAERFAAAYRRLAAFVIANAHEFDRDKKGLTFTSAGKTAEARALWDDVNRLLESFRQAATERMEFVLSQEVVRRDELIALKKQIRTESDGSADDIRRVRSLDLDINYLDEIIKQADDRKKKLERAAAKEKEKEKEAADRAASASAS